MDPYKKNQLLALTIEGYGSEGEGVAHLPDGMTCFVKGALAGEVCTVQLLKVGRTAAWGRVVNIISSSPARQAPDCPAFPKCGGCALRHMTYEEELVFKRQKVQDALRRIGGVDTPVSAIYGANNTLRYRNKVQFPVGADGAIGFFRARSHDVVDTEDCLLQPEDAVPLRNAVKKWMEAYRIQPYNEVNHNGLLRHLYLRFSRKKALVCLVVNGTSLPHSSELVAALRAACPSLAGVAVNYNTEKTNVILGKRTQALWGEPWLDDTLRGLTFRLSVPSFYQVNRDQTEVLYGLALEFAGLTGAETVLDLYCGIGTITLCLAQRAGRVYGAEVVPQAIQDAKANATRNGIGNAEFFCGDAAEVVARFEAEGIRPDVVCVDPPRKGLAPQVVGSIARMDPKRVVYVSCDPATLARDVKRFGELGYAPEKAVAVDLFPRTPHVETVVSLLRKHPLTNGL